AISRRFSRLHDLARLGTGELTRMAQDAGWPEIRALAPDFLRTLPKILPIEIGRLESLADISLPLQPCIRDIWHDHVLFTANDVTGVIDFGAVDMDTPATDIARLLG